MQRSQIIEREFDSDHKDSEREELFRKILQQRSQSSLLEYFFDQRKEQIRFLCKHEPLKRQMLLLQFAGVLDALQKFHMEKALQEVENEIERKAEETLPPLMRRTKVANTPHKGRSRSVSVRSSPVQRLYTPTPSSFFYQHSPGRDSTLPPSSPSLQDHVAAGRASTPSPPPLVTADSHDGSLLSPSSGARQPQVFAVSASVAPRSSTARHSYHGSLFSPPRATPLQLSPAEPLAPRHSSVSSSCSSVPPSARQLASRTLVAGSPLFSGPNGRSNQKWWRREDPTS